MAKRNENIQFNIDTKNAVKNTNTLGKEIKAVGDRTHSLKTEIRLMKEEMFSLDPASDKFKELSFNVSELETVINNVNSNVRVLASTTLKLDQTIGIIQGVAGAYGAVQGTMVMLGVENENLDKVMNRLMASMAVTNGLLQVSNSLNKTSASGILLRDVRTKALAITTALYSKATAVATTVTGTQITATNGATIATNALRISMLALPILAIIAGITALVGLFMKWNKESEDVAKANKNLDLASERLSQNIKNDYEKSVKDFTESIKDLNREYKKGEITIDDYNETALQLMKDEEARISKDIQNTTEQYTLKKGQIDDFMNTMKQRGYTEARVEQEFRKEFGISHQAYNNTLGEMRKLNDERRDYLSELRDVIIDTEANITKATEDELKKRRQQYLKNQELIFLIQQQKDINELNNIKRLVDEEELGSLKRIDIIRKQFSTEEKIINDKYKEQIRVAKATITDATELANTLLLIDLKKTEELENLQHRYTQTIKKENNEQIITTQKTTNDILNITKKATTDTTTEYQKQHSAFSRMLFNMKEEWGSAWEQMSTSEKIGAVTQVIEQVITKTQELMAAMNESSQIDLENNLANLNNQMNEQTLLFQSQLANRQISQEEYDSKMEQAERERTAKETNLKREQFNRDKKMNIATTAMNMAVGVMQAFAQMGPIMGAIMSAFILVTGAIQIANIKKQKFQANRGGIVPGMPSNQDSVDAYLAPGEAVINANSTSQFKPLLSRINEMGGGESLVPDSFSMNLGDISKSYSSNEEKHINIVPQINNYEWKEKMEEFDRATNSNRIK